jgi:acyl-CoA reductase-like NAD-dependent aldehyde dehydrogenase
MALSPAGGSGGGPPSAVTDRLDAARDRIGRAVFKKWDKRDIDELTRLMRKFADAMTVDPPAVR